MAARRTRLKGRKTPQSTVKRRSATSQTKKNAATPTGDGKMVKRMPGKVSPKVVKKAKPKAEQKRPKKDQYEFDETDDFISGNSFLSASFSANGSQKTPEKGLLTTVRPSKVNVIKQQKGNVTKQQKGNVTKQQKGNVTKQQKGKEKKGHNQCAPPAENKKKTSTPLSEVADRMSKPGKSCGKGQRYLQVLVPKLGLDMDMSVTPILPITDQSPRTQASLRQLGKKGSDGKSVSFEDLKEHLPSQTPAGKINCKKTPRKAVVVSKSSSSSASGSFKEPALPVLPLASAVSAPAPRKTEQRTTESAPAPRKTLKRKMCELREEDAVDRAAAKCQKTDLPKTKQSLVTCKKSGLSQKAKECVKNRWAKKYPPSSQTQLSPPQMRILRQRTPTPSVQGEEEGTHDSGISLGEDLSTSEDRNSAATPTLPGFMEDEPLQGNMDFLNTSPLSSVEFTSSKEVSTVLYKSAAKEYRPAKNKREKGRYSTSKLEAWASAVNQSLQDVESFELVVECQ
ncbi:uncharacterized protein LOC143296166 [Babylonia areolata]|uniref:uncharacterized protein LOC143296166 n=1 Tax=Babylonia areolata TaxID=304850 RepID=UPI003FD1F492